MPKNEYICDCNMVHKEMVQDTLSKMPENETLNNLADLSRTSLTLITRRSLVLNDSFDRQYCYLGVFQCKSR